MYNFNLSISDKNYSSKEDIIWSKVSYSQSNINLPIFEYLIKEGYNFCYNFKDKKINQSQKTINNWCSTKVMFIDVDDANKDVESFTNNLEFKPTLYYTTYSNTDTNYRFRLVYCFEEEINDIDVYKNIYQNIVYTLERDNEFKMKDNCAMNVNQQFAGNGNRDSIIYNIYNIIYNINIFYNKYINIYSNISFNKTYNKIYNKNISINSNINLNTNSNIIEYRDNQKYHSNSIKEEERNIIELERYFQDEEYIKDYWNESYSNILEKYNDKYYQFDSTYLDFSNDDIPYILLPENYIEIKRYWIYEKNEDDKYISSKVKKLKDGEGRKRKLFINAILRRKILPDITFEHLLNNLIYELYYYINNSKDTINKKQLFEICKNAMNTDITKYHFDNTEKRTFIVNPNYCLKYNVNKKQARNIAKKIINSNKIGELYDCSLTDKENLKIFKENGLDISLITLKRWRKDNNITKYKIKPLEEDKPIINIVCHPIVENGLNGLKMANTSVKTDIINDYVISNYNFKHY